MNVIVIIAMLTCLAIGYYVGRICTEDANDARAHKAAHPAPPRHARTQVVRLVPREPATGELLALAAAEAARFPVAPTFRFPALESPGAR